MLRGRDLMQPVNYVRAGSQGLLLLKSGSSAQSRPVCCTIREERVSRLEITHFLLDSRNTGGVASRRNTLTRLLPRDAIPQPESALLTVVRPNWSSERSIPTHLPWASAAPRQHHSEGRSKCSSDPRSKGLLYLFSW